jgi:hypothetical protein
MFRDMARDERIEPGEEAQAPDPAEAFAEIRDALLAEPGTTEGTGFGSMPGVKVDGKIAAMLMDGRLVVKLPAERCDKLVATGGAEPLRMGKRTMREWVSIDQSHPAWVALALDAVAYVRP